MSKRKKQSRRRSRYRENEDVNPMNYTANIADAMLILSVGIMLALIMHWNVDVSTTGGDMSDSGMRLQESSLDSGRGGNEQVDKENAISFDEEKMEVAEKELLDGEGMNKLGEVYYDEETQKYYVIEKDE